MLSSAPTPDSGGRLICADGLTCEPVESVYRVRLGGREVKLPPIPGKILSVLLPTPLEPKPVWMLGTFVYGDDGPGDQISTLYMHVSNLRRYLRDGGIRVDIRSCPGKGYTYHGASLMEGWRQPALSPRRPPRRLPKSRQTFDPPPPQERISP
jgi:DNA-binding winged helix-turn-helix (wHTH) protein